MINYPLVPPRKGEGIKQPETGHKFIWQGSDFPIISWEI